MAKRRNRTIVHFALSAAQASRDSPVNRTGTLACVTSQSNHLSVSGITRTTLAQCRVLSIVAIEFIRELWSFVRTVGRRLQLYQWRHHHFRFRPLLERIGGVGSDFS